MAGPKATMYRTSICPRSHNHRTLSGAFHCGIRLLDRAGKLLDGPLMFNSYGGSAGTLFTYHRTDGLDLSDEEIAEVQRLHDKRNRLLLGTHA